MLKLKKMPNIAGRLHYKCQSRNDHLYIKEDKIKKEMPDEFEIPISQWNDYFTIISRDEFTEAEFEEDEEMSEILLKERKKREIIEREIEVKLREHAKNCILFKNFMDLAFRSFSIKNGWVNPKPSFYKFTGCPFCDHNFDGF